VLIEWGLAQWIVSGVARLTEVPDDVEAEFTVGGGAEGVAERVAAELAWPAAVAAFDLADLVGVEGCLGGIVLGDVGVDRVG
jgi:hypothetical protein